MLPVRVDMTVRDDERLIVVVLLVECGRVCVCGCVRLICSDTDSETFVGVFEMLLDRELDCDALAEGDSVGCAETLGVSVVDGLRSVTDT